MKRTSKEFERIKNHFCVYYKDKYYYRFSLILNFHKKVFVVLWIFCRKSIKKIGNSVVSRKDGFFIQLSRRFEVNILLHPLEKMKNGRSSIHVNITFQHFQGVLLLYQVKR